MKQGYVLAVEAAGGLPVLVTADLSDPLGVVERLDALLLAGGSDVDPAQYGESPHATVKGIDNRRDGLEMGFVKQALAVGMPVLAICRGMQVLNVALGGTLHQHLPELAGCWVDHGPSRDTSHSVSVAPDSLLASICGTRIEQCPSRHHQGVSKLGRHLKPVGWSDDGLVEALEPTHGEVIAVQWHPERASPNDPVQKRLFSWVVERAKVRQGALR